METLKREEAPPFLTLTEEEIKKVSKYLKIVSNTQSPYFSDRRDVVFEAKTPHDAVAAFVAGRVVPFRQTKMRA